MRAIACRTSGNIAPRTGVEQQRLVGIDRNWLNVKPSGAASGTKVERR